MPRRIPLRRARGGEDDAATGCATEYMKVVAALVVLVVVGTFCQMAYEARSVLVPLFGTVFVILLIIAIIQERAQFAYWRVSVEEQIEKWLHDEKRFVAVVVFFSILICLILATLGVVALQRR